MLKHYLLTFFTLFLFFLAEAQPYPIGDATFSFTDPARANRTVSGTVYYPATSAGSNTGVAMGQFPIIVLGHGFTIGIGDYFAWWNGLVPEGYILILPDTEGGLSPNHGTFGDDMSFLVDTYLAMNTTGSSNFFQKLNGKSAVMGHSMGGGSSFLAAASNPNITAHVSLAAAETTPSAIGAAGSITIPSLVIAGSLDCVAPPAANQIAMYNALASSYKAYIEITNGSHCQFADASGFFSTCVLGESVTCGGSSFISQTSQHTQMIDATLTWFDFWLKCECEAWNEFQTYLTGNPPLHTYMDAGAAPTNYPATTSSSNVTGTSATLNWSTVAGTALYYICYRPIGTSTWMTTTATGTSTNLTGLTAGITYEYIVAADCSGCNDPNAPINTFMTTNNTPTCSDGIQNGTETGVDCGGTCPPCCYNNLTNSNGLANSETGVADYESSTYINTTANTTIQSSAMVDYDAATYIQLNPDFTVNLGAVFNAFIDGCNGGTGGVNLRDDVENDSDALKVEDSQRFLYDELEFKSKRIELMKNNFPE